jgi:hypothetical protein
MHVVPLNTKATQCRPPFNAVGDARIADTMAKMIGWGREGVRLPLWAINGHACTYQWHQDRSHNHGREGSRRRTLHYPTLLAFEVVRGFRSRLQRASLLDRWYLVHHMQAPRLRL